MIKTIKFDENDGRGFIQDKMNKFWRENEISQEQIIAITPMSKGEYHAPIIYVTYIDIKG